MTAQQLARAHAGISAWAKQRKGRSRKRRLRTAISASRKFVVNAFNQMRAANGLSNAYISTRTRLKISWGVRPGIARDNRWQTSESDIIDQRFIFIFMKGAGTEATAAIARVAASKLVIRDGLPIRNFSQSECRASHLQIELSVQYIALLINRGESHRERSSSARPCGYLLRCDVNGSELLRTISKRNRRLQHIPVGA
jgi:hypothetical protein